MSDYYNTPKLKAGYDFLNRAMGPALTLILASRDFSFTPQDKFDMLTKWAALSETIDRVVTGDAVLPPREIDLNDSEREFILRLRRNGIHEPAINTPKRATGGRRAA